MLSEANHIWLRSALRWSRPGYAYAALRRTTGISRSVFSLYES